MPETFITKRGELDLPITHKNHLADGLALDGGSYNRAQTKVFAFKSSRTPSAIGLILALPGLDCVAVL